MQKPLFQSVAEVSRELARVDQKYFSECLLPCKTNEEYDAMCLTLADNMTSIMNHDQLLRMELVFARALLKSEALV